LALNRQVNVIMLDTNEATHRIGRRAEVLGGVVRRRRWTDAEKGRIVSEAIAPGAVIAVVARRHELTPQHLSNWIRAAKAGHIVLPEEAAIAFVPVVAEQGKTGAGSLAPIEIVVGPMVLRLPFGTDAGTLEAVIRALKRA
jgi:transposase